MHKFAKALLLTLVIAAPVAINAPTVQAATAKTATVAAPKASKTHHKYRHARKHHTVNNTKSNAKKG